MSDTPTFANLLTQWSSGDSSVRRSVYAHLHAHPNEAAAVEAFFRDDLRSRLPWRRLIAAEAVLEVYRDEASAASALEWVLARGEPTTSPGALGVLESLSPATAAPLLARFALHDPDTFAALTPAFHRRAGVVLAQAPDEWLKVFDHTGAAVESGLLLGLADAAREAQVDLTALVPAVRSRLLDDGSGYAAGAALWRITWRVNRDWLTSIDPHSPRFGNDPALLVLVTEVLIEHLGRRPDLAPVVRDLLIRIMTDAHEACMSVLDKLIRLGGRGWAVLLPLLGDPTVPPVLRCVLFTKAAQIPAVVRLAHHRAHRVLLERAADRKAVPEYLLGSAANLLAALGPCAESVVPDLLELIAQQPETASELVPALGAVAPGYPNTGAAVARTLDQLRRSVVFPTEAFSALAQVFAGLNFDGVTKLVDDTALNTQTVECLLQEGPWKTAPADVRRRHTRAIADRLGSPRADVRLRAVTALRAYPDQLCEVWPALVAILLGNDERAVRLALPLFHHLEPVADAVEDELAQLFNEPNPVRAARAVVALSHLGRTDPEATARCHEVLTDTTGAWNWAVPTGVSERLVRSVANRRPFAAPIERVAERVHDLLFAEESLAESALSAHITPGSIPRVNWPGLSEYTDPEGGLLFLALMCAFGSRGFTHKIYLIKHQRLIAGTGLGDAKAIVERAVDAFSRPVAPDERRDCVRAYFPPTSDIPAPMTELLRHRFAWYRWAGLELLDAWGAPDRVPELVGARLRDRSELVRLRARRMPYC